LRDAAVEKAIGSVLELELIAEVAIAEVEQRVNADLHIINLPGISNTGTIVTGLVAVFLIMPAKFSHEYPMMTR
jgi:hypothetical protein